MIAHILPVLLATALQAVSSSPMASPQGVTARLLPGSPAPAGCSASYPVAFGLSTTRSTKAKRQLTQIGDGQIQAVPANYGPGNVNQISDGQIQAPVPGSGMNQINDGQIQSPVARSEFSSGKVGQINDGQIQIQQNPATPQANVNQISDGQIQAPVPGMNQISDGQIQSPVRRSDSPNGNVGQINDGQIQIPGPAPPGIKQINDGQIQTASLERRQNGRALQVELRDGVLTDSRGRTGYIADNRQLQFDSPPQSGAQITAGFSACEDGTLALGGSKTFYACASSDYSNIYDRAVNPNCRPVNLFIVR